ncbi:MAG: hypothetical protein FWC03_08995 [Treponema sp.]|nr:hypothetical protein [Treponema sp.]
MEPVNIEIFLEDETVQEIIEKGMTPEEPGPVEPEPGPETEGSNVEVELEPINEGEPQLYSGSSPINGGSVVTLSYYAGSGTAESVVISVHNHGEFAEINWYCGDIETPLDTVSGEKGEEITVTSGTSPFDLVGDFLLTVITQDEQGVQRSSYVTIRIVLN